MTKYKPYPRIFLFIRFWFKSETNVSKFFCLKLPPMIVNSSNKFKFFGFKGLLLSIAFKGFCFSIITNFSIALNIPLSLNFPLLRFVKVFIILKILVGAFMFKIKWFLGGIFCIPSPSSSTTLFSLQWLQVRHHCNGCCKAFIFEKN